MLLAGETLALRAFLRARVTLVLSPGLTGFVPWLHPEAIRWAWLACRTVVDVWDFDGWGLFAERIVSVARAGRAVGAASRPHPPGGGPFAWGELDTGALVLEEVDAINEATGTHVAPAIPLILETGSTGCSRPHFWALRVRLIPIRSRNCRVRLSGVLPSRGKSREGPVSGSLSLSQTRSTDVANSGRDAAVSGIGRVKSAGRPKSAQMRLRISLIECDANASSNASEPHHQLRWSG